MPDRHAARRLTDSQLIATLARLVREDRRLTAQLLVHLAEVDERKLYLEHACSSMHVYCVERLHMSDQQAYRRIHAARAVRRFPRVLDMIERNELHLSGVTVLAPHLTEENHGELLRAAKHEPKRQIERLVAERFPQPDAPPMIRRLPQPRVAAPSPRPAEPVAQPTAALPPPPPRAAVTPTAPERYKVQFTANASLAAKLREARDLMRHQIPDGDIAEIFERALDGLLREVKKARFGATETPRPRPRSERRTRHIPNDIKRTVYERDTGRCTYVDAGGNRCTATSRIEYHHIRAYAAGGEHSADNLTLRCAAHNRHAADKELGREVIEAKLREARRLREARAALPGKSPPLFARESRAHYSSVSVCPSSAVACFACSCGSPPRRSRQRPRSASGSGVVHPSPRPPTLCSPTGTGIDSIGQSPFGLLST